MYVYYLDLDMFILSISLFSVIKVKCMNFSISITSSLAHLRFIIKYHVVPGSVYLWCIAVICHGN